LPPAGTATECRFGSTAALLGTGNVLVAGGLVGTNSNPGTTNAAILYNPATNSWTTTDSMATAREGQTADLLASGQVPVAGGGTFAKHAATPLSSAELYTPLKLVTSSGAAGRAGRGAAVRAGRGTGRRHPDK
jgi:hypothetical protein